MKQVSFWFINIFCICVAFAAQAQPKNLIKQTAKTATQIYAPGPALSHYGGALGSAMGVNFYLTRAALQASATQAVSADLGTGRTWKPFCPPLPIDA